MTAQVIPHPAQDLAAQLEEADREVAWAACWAHDLRDRVKHWSGSPWWDAGTQETAIGWAFAHLDDARARLKALEAQAQGGQRG